MATANVYANFFANAFNGNLPDIEDTDNLECMLLDENHSFSETNNTVDDISANEITDADYSRQTLTGVTVNRSTGTITVDADDISFGSTVSITASHAVIFVVGGTDETSYLMFDVDFEGSQESVDGEFTLQIHEDGLFDVVT